MPRPKRTSAHVQKQGELVWWREYEGQRKEGRGHFGEVLSFDRPTANVNVNLRGKVNLGNYESAEAGVSLTLPCLPEPKAIERAYRAARAFCEEKMEQLIGQVRGEAR